MPELLRLFDFFMAKVSHNRINSCIQEAKYIHSALFWNKKMYKRKSKTYLHSLREARHDCLRPDDGALVLAEGVERRPLERVKDEDVRLGRLQTEGVVAADPGGLHVVVLALLEGL